MRKRAGSDAAGYELRYLRIHGYRPIGYRLETLPPVGHVQDRKASLTSTYACQAWPSYAKLGRLAVRKPAGTAHRDGAAMGPTDQERRELGRRNLILLAERLHWPDGALGVVQRLEVAYPEYSAWWGPGRPASPKPGFYAVRASDSYSRTLYGRDESELATAIQADLLTRVTEWWQR